MRSCGAFADQYQPGARLALSLCLVSSRLLSLSRERVVLLVTLVCLETCGVDGDCTSGGGSGAGLGHSGRQLW